jgi:hypothetical protein
MYMYYMYINRTSFSVEQMRIKKKKKKKKELSTLKHLSSCTYVDLCPFFLTSFTFTHLISHSQTTSNCHMPLTWYCRKLPHYAYFHFLFNLSCTPFPIPSGLQPDRQQLTTLAICANRHRVLMCVVRHVMPVL